MKTTTNKLAAPRRWFIKSLVLGFAASAVTLSVMAATGRFSSVTCVRAVRVDRTHYDLYARASGQYQFVQFGAPGRWGFRGENMGNGNWRFRDFFGHPGVTWGARTIQGIDRPDAVDYATLP